MARLFEIAKVIRSKNSGPFEITLDILFNDRDLYFHIKKNEYITRDLIARLYRLEPGLITEFVYFDAALGIKATYLRAVSSGTIGDRDVYGAQQHAPLFDIEIPWEGEPYGSCKTG